MKQQILWKQLWNVTMKIRHKYQLGQDEKGKKDLLPCWLCLTFLINYVIIDMIKINNWRHMYE